MARKKDILVIALPDYKDNNNGKDMLIDFVFESDDYIEKSVSTKEELTDFFKNISDVKLNKTKGMYYHLLKVKDYIGENRKGLYRTLDTKLFDPGQVSLLPYEILSTMGIGFFLRLDSAYFIVMPSRLTLKQKNSLVNLKKYVKDNNFYLHIVEDLKTKYDFEGITYDEVLENLKINESKKEVRK